MGMYTKLKIDHVEQETDDAISIYFKQPMFSKIHYKSGQFLTLCVGMDGEELHRAYSLNSADKVDDLLSVTIKKVPGGKVSNYLFDNIKPGDKLKVMKPQGRFTYEPEPTAIRHIVLFGGGSGITPLVSIAKAALSFEPQSHVTLFYCNRNEGSIIFNEKLKELNDRFSKRFTVHHMLQEPPAHWTGLSGKLDQKVIASLLNRQHSMTPIPAARSEYFICGPEGLMTTVSDSLLNINVPEAKIHMESFTAALSGTASVVDDIDFEEKVINLQVGRKSYSLTVPPDKTILQAATDNDIKIPHSCGSGSCGSCMGKCNSGEVKMVGGNVLSEKDIAKGYVLTCVGHPTTDDVDIRIG